MFIRILTQFVNIEILWVFFSVLQPLAVEAQPPDFQLLTAGAPPGGGNDEENQLSASSHHQQSQPFSPPPGPVQQQATAARSLQESHQQLVSTFPQGIAEPQGSVGTTRSC